MPYTKHKNIGVIGLGIIGGGISAHLRRKRFQVFVWNRTPRPVPNFVGSPAELAELCDCIQIFVSNDEALLQTVHQLSEKLTTKHIILAHSTVTPDSMRVAAEVVEGYGARFVEAPFTGSKIAAEKGELVYYAGGKPASLREARPILEASSKRIIEIGEIGQATAVKIATNMLTAASVQALAEALGLIQALGVPLEKFAEAMQANASYSTTLAMKMPKMVQRDFEPHFSVKHMLKDMQIANQLALSHYLDLGVTTAARDRLIEQIQWGHGDDDFSAVARQYLPEAAPVSNEQPQIEDQGEHANGVAGAPARDSAPASADLEKTRPEREYVAANAREATMLPGGETKIAAQLRQSFLSQLVHRGMQLLRQPFSSREG
jgi:3-hydroxyisobutyrate dehydrogenase-like beta-hydroxyacid dehydrogenase